MSRFSHLKVPDQWNQYFTKYPQGYTILEALLNWVAQVDALTDNVNKWNDYLDEFVITFDKEIQSTITTTLQEWQDSGLLEIIINDALQTQMDVLEQETHNKLNNFQIVVDDVAEKLDSTLYTANYTREPEEVDDLGLLNRAFLDAKNQGKKKVVITGNYEISTEESLILHSDIEYVGINAKIDFSKRPTRATTLTTPLILGEGSYDLPINITSDTLLNTTTIDLESTRGLKAGDLILITSNYKWTGDLSGHQHGELNVIKRVLSETRIELLTKTQDKYLITGPLDQDTTTTGNLNPRIQRVEPIKNIQIKNIHFVGFGRDSDQRGDYGLTIKAGRNVKIEGCTFERIDQCALDLISVYGFDVVSNTFIFDEKDLTAINDFIQYGIKISNASMYGNIERNKVYGSRHGVVTGHTVETPGIQRHNIINDNFITGTWHAGISTHNSTEWLQIKNNTLIGCQQGINTRCSHVDIVGNHLEGCNFPIHLTIKPLKTKVLNNRIYEGTTGVYVEAIRTGHVVHDIVIDGNYIEGVEAGITILDDKTSTLRRGLLIKNNELKRIRTSRAITISGRFSGEIANNSIYWVMAAYGMQLDGVAYLHITRNRIEKTADRCVVLRPVTINESTYNPTNNIVDYNHFYDFTPGFFSDFSEDPTNIQENNKAISSELS